MLGERSDQRGLWEADRLYLDHVGRESFYGLLASLRGRLFRDAEFAEFYCADNGRDLGDGAAAPVPRQGRIPRPRPGPTSISGGRLRWRIGPLPRARCRCFAPS